MDKSKNRECNCHGRLVSYNHVITGTTITLHVKSSVWSHLSNWRMICQYDSFCDDEHLHNKYVFFEKLYEKNLQPIRYIWQIYSYHIKINHNVKKWIDYFNLVTIILIAIVCIDIIVSWLSNHIVNPTSHFFIIISYGLKSNSMKYEQDCRPKLMRHRHGLHNHVLATQLKMLLSKCSHLDY